MRVIWGAWTHLLEHSRNGFLNIPSLAVIHLWVLAWFLLPTAGASKYWWRKCKGLSDGIGSAGDLFAASHAEFRSLRVTGEVFSRPPNWPKAWKGTSRVLQFGSSTGVIQRGIVSDVYAIRDSIRYQKYFVGWWPYLFLYSNLGLGKGLNAIHSFFNFIYIHSMCCIENFRSDAHPARLSSDLSAGVGALAAFEVPGVLVKRRWDLQRWPLCIYLYTHIYIIYVYIYMVYNIIYKFQKH